MKDDEKNLRAALRTIRQLAPTATRALFQTSDQDTYGFVLDDVILIDATRLGHTQPEALQTLNDAVEQYLNDLSWNSAMHEDRSGAADVAVPEASWFQEQDAARFCRLATIPTLPGPLPPFTAADGSPDQPWGGLSLRELTAQNWDGDGEFRDDVSAEATQYDNTRRAGFALVAVSAYFDRVATDEESALSDLLGDLRHLCDALGEDFEALCQRSEADYAAEAQARF